MNKIIETYKSVQRKQYFKKLGNYRLGYAFVGAGNHSISNLYPCIRHLGIPIRYICTQHKENAGKLAALFPNCTGTDSIDTILEDPGINAVFICTQAEKHFQLTSRFLAKGKHVFVEKPLCFSMSELQQLIELQQDTICMTGLQKRFSPLNRALEKKIKNADSYVYRYVTGAYPEGDVAMELFVHPIENVMRLFGQAAIKSILIKKNGAALTCFLQLQHINNTIGMIELSTGYSWEHPVDQLEINTPREILSAHYPYELTGVEKSRTLLNIPLEKVFKNPLVQRKYINRPGFVPVADHNSLVMQGFYGEIEHFSFLAERDERDALSKLETLLPVYDLLEQIQKEVNG